MLNQPEISKLGQDYAEKAGRLLPAIKDTGEYNLTYLYKNLHKNADRVANQEEDYPVIQHEFDGAKHSFSNSPQFSEAFNSSLPALKTLFEIDLDHNAPCLSLNKTYADDESHHTFYKRSKSKQGPKEIKVAPITQDSINLCPENHCKKCVECKAHQDELVKSLRGVLSHDPNTGDGMRNLHIKNLMSTLNSWAAHQDSRGFTASTVDDHDYDNDNYQHSLLSTSIREMNNKLRRAYQNDFVLSQGTGGGVHKDYLGQEYSKKTDAR